MSPLTLHFLRRLTLAAVVMSVLLWAVPPALRYLGWLGPDAAEQVETAQRALDAAGRFGAGEHLPAWGQAQAQIARARQALQAGRRREAVRAAREARRLAFDAQRAALAERADLSRRATAIIERLDRELNALESQFDEAARGRRRSGLGRHISLMKATRQSVARLFVAFEQDDFRAVVQGEAAALATLADARRTLAELSAASEPAPAR
jgi:hypothetical protein